MNDPERQEDLESEHDLASHDLWQIWNLLRGKQAAPRGKITPEEAAQQASEFYQNRFQETRSKQG